jgi:hypothetical protein
MNPPSLQEQYNQVESLYKKLMLDVRASGLQYADRFIWYTRMYKCLDHATAEAQLTALNAVRAQWDQRVK